MIPPSRSLLPTTCSLWYHHHARYYRPPVRYDTTITLVITDHQLTLVYDGSRFGSGPLRTEPIVLQQTNNLVRFDPLKMDDWMERGRETGCVGVLGSDYVWCVGVWSVCMWRGVCMGWLFMVGRWGWSLFGICMWWWSGVGSLVCVYKVVVGVCV